MPPRYLTDYLDFIGATQQSEAIAVVSTDEKYLFVFERFSQETQILLNTSNEHPLGEHVVEN